MKRFLYPAKILPVLFLVLLLVMAFTACTSYAPTPTSPTPRPSISPSPTLAPAPAPIIAITAPTSPVPAPGNVTVSVEVSNFNLAEKLGVANISGEGHIHYFMDVEAPIAQGKPAVTAAGTYAATSATSYTWSNVPGGTHNFSVELVNNDHTPLDPPVVAEIVITVVAATQTPTPTPTATAASLSIDLTASGFKFDKQSITVTAGAQVTMVFNNKDSAPHNFALYTDSTAKTVIFRGDIVSSKTITYQFTAPSTPGSYFFRCDVHPTSMTGTFIVTAP